MFNEKQKACIQELEEYILTRNNSRKDLEIDIALNEETVKELKMKNMSNEEWEMFYVEHITAIPYKTIVEENNFKRQVRIYLT